MSEKLQWFKFFATDWLSDPYVRLMTSRQRGWYIDLLCWSWQEGGYRCSDAEIICQVFRDRQLIDSLAATEIANTEANRQITEELQAVISHFRHKCGGGKISHPKLEVQRTDRVSVSESASERGKKGNEIRWGKQEKKPSLQRHNGDPSAIAKNREPEPDINTEVESKAAAFSTPTQEQKTPPPPASPGKQNRKPPSLELAPDFSDHDAEKVDLVRAYMAEIAKVAHLPPCDDQLLARVLEICRAVHVSVVFDVIRDLVRRRRLQNVQSWGLIPLLLQNYFKKARAAGA